MDDVKAMLVEVWRILPPELIDQCCQSFYKKLNRCIVHVGNNNLDG